MTAKPELGPWGHRRVALPGRVEPRLCLSITNYGLGLIEVIGLRLWKKEEMTNDYKTVVRIGNLGLRNVLHPSLL